MNGEVCCANEQIRIIQVISAEARLQSLKMDVA